MQDTNVLRTLEELDWARQNNPAVLEHYLGQVTILEDLKKYLRFLDDNEITTTLTTELKRHKRREKGIHPSSACKKNVCLLKLYYECTFAIEPAKKFDAQSQLTWDIGTMLHVMLQTHLKAMYGEQFQYEVPLRRGAIKSSTDGLFSFTNYRFILEIKSIKEGGNFGWETIQAKPMEDNVRQAHFYMWLANVPMALLFYINKNGSEFKEHAVVFDPDTWSEIERDVLQPVVSTVYENGPMVPARPGWHCKWCDFAHSCPERGGKQDGDSDWSEKRP
jgi:CRISPR/Cas system-associated exonuclease Cas4 (RecB family)